MSLPLSSRFACASLCLWLIGMYWSEGALGAQLAELRVDRVSSPGLELTDLRVRHAIPVERPDERPEAQPITQVTSSVASSQTNSRLNLSLGHLLLGAVELSQLSVDCSDAALNGAKIECKAMLARFSHPQTADPISLAGDVALREGASIIQFDLVANMGAAGAGLAGDLILAGPGEGSGELEVELTELLLENVVALIPVAPDPLTPDPLTPGPLAGQGEYAGNQGIDTAGVPTSAAETESDSLVMESLSGLLNGRVKLALENYDPRQVDYDLEFSGLGFDTQSGSIAAADVAVASQGSVAFVPDQQADPSSLGVIELDTTMDWRGGELLAGPLYLSSPVQPVALNFSGSLNQDQVIISQAAINDGDALRAQLNNSLYSPTAMSLNLQIDQVDLGLAYARYVKPLAASYGFGRLETAGQASGTVVIDTSSGVNLDIRFDEVFVDDQAGRFLLSGLAGDLVWSSSTESRGGSLNWEQMMLYAIEIGSGSIPYSSSNGGFRIQQAVSIPILDGALELTNLNVGVVAGELSTFDLKANLQPISMEALSAALDWPALSGSLSGRIPGVRYLDGVLEIDGAMEFDAFDGRIVLSQLRLERPFGVLPSLAAEVLVDRLDLAVLTRAFEFGRIEGQLSGRIKELRMLDWEPVQFDAALTNPEDDPNRHRISQRAIENISSIGGSGAAAALSRGFLRVFDDFGYDRLGITCRLRNDVCRMGGVGPAAKGGYYLVRGAGLPRLDVVAFASEVDWPTLLSRLKAASSSSDVQIN